MSKEVSVGTIPTYDADTASVALATNTATYSVQNGRVGVQMSA